MPSFDALAAELEDRRSYKTADSLSGSALERVTYRGEPMVLKHVCVDEDWIMRATGDLHCRVLRLFSSELIERIPRSIDHATIAVAPYVAASGHTGCVLLLRDVSDALVPTGSEMIQLETHRLFIEHMAELHASFWDYTDTLELIPLAHHYTILTPRMAELEQARGGTDAVPRAVAAGWLALHRAAPRLAAVLEQVARDPGPLASALAAAPQTLCHGDWKLGNLGSHADGRTVLLDWDRCGRAPAAFDLAWYLAVNCDRLPESKEATVDAYLEALRSRGIDTAEWWEQQLALALLGAALMLAWSKVSDAVELGWWADRVFEAERLLS